MSFLRSRLFLAVLMSAYFIGTISAFSAEPLTIGQTFLTRGLDPTKGSNGWALVSHGIGENLFTVDQDGNLVPQLAIKAMAKDKLTWIISLQKDRHFSDGSPVTATDLAAGFTKIFADNKAALATGGKLTFGAQGPLTLQVTTERAVPNIQALFAEWPLIAFKPLGDNKAVFSGPYAVSDFKADSSLSLIPNKYYQGADKRDPIIIRKFGDAQAMTLALESGTLDLAFGLPSETIARLKNNADLHIKSFPVGYQYFAWINTQRPILADIKVRQALDLSFNRAELSAAINGGDIATGAYAPYFPFAGKKARDTNVTQAGKLLQQAGWQLNKEGKREKAGKLLSVKILTYPQRPDLVTMLPVVKAQLARVGISVTTQIVDNISQTLSEGDYDLALWAQHTAPSGDPAFFLNSMLKSGASMNHAKYSSDVFDQLIAEFSTETDPQKRHDIAHQAQAQLFEDVPISFLISPVWYVGTSQRLADYQPWGSDYHVLRAKLGK